MKHTLKFAAALLWFTLASLQPATVFAQGTAFTYQGRLQNNGSPASGTYNLTFTLFNTNAAGVAVAGPLIKNGVVITNGLFTVLIDFGSGAFTGTNYWLEIGVETNGGGPFTTLAPRQPLTPTPYAIYAESVAASNIIGTLIDTQLTHSAVTVNPGPGLSGGGKVGLGNTITLTNTGVLSITGNADITVATVGGAVTLGDTASSADTAITLVKRDGSGNFSAASITLDGNLNLPATTPAVGIIYSGGVTMIHAYGAENFFAGPNAGNLTMSGTYDTAVGQLALKNNTSGVNNTAEGYSALYDNQGGSFNTAIGAWTLAANTNGAGNTAVGYVALGNNTSGSANTANGSGAMFNNTIGSYNTANGDNALYSNMNGLENTASGYQALYSNTDGSDNTAVGYEALYSNTNGQSNTAGGYQALYSNTSGTYNTASGFVALFFNTIGSGNTANGSFVLEQNTSGSENTANGFEALNVNTSGNNNSANGAYALHSNANGSGNTANGYNALPNNTSGSDNTANGRASLYNNADGIQNTADGVQALNNNTSGSGNIALGYQAGFNLTTGGNNIYIGNVGTGTGFSSTENNIIRIGKQGTHTATYLAGTVYANGVALTSDRNAKENFTAVNGRDVLARVAALPVTEWNYKTDSKSVQHIGPMAQDFQAAFGLAGSDDKHISVVDEGGVALAAIQGLNQKLEAENAELKARLDRLEKLIHARNGEAF